MTAIAAGLFAAGAFVSYLARGLSWVTIVFVGLIALGIAGILDALEAQYPVLRGTIRDHGTLARRPFLRYFACNDPTALTLMIQATSSFFMAQRLAR